MNLKQCKIAKEIESEKDKMKILEVDRKLRCVENELRMIVNHKALM